MKIVLGELDVEAGWKETQQALKDRGIDKVQAAHQKWYDARKKWAGFSAAEAGERDRRPPGPPVTRKG
jgi:hypothetical protein